MKIYLGRCHVPRVGIGAFSHKIDWITLFKDILNLEGHRIADSRVTATLLKKVNFPTGQSGEASWWRACYQRGLPCLVLLHLFAN